MRITLKSSSPKILRIRYNILIIMTMVLGFVSTIITVLVSEFNVRQFQIQKITSLALMIDADKIRVLSGSADDINNPLYRDLKDKLTRVREVNPEMRFLYVMRYQQGEIVFIADSEDPESGDYSAPGDTFDEASEVFKSAFTTNKAGFELDRDRWGYWLSSFAQVIDPETGENMAVLGADIDAYSQYFLPIIRSALLPVIAFSFLLLVLWSNRKYMLFQIEAMEEKGAILHVISHEVRTPLTEIRWACELVLDENDFEKDSLIRDAITQVYKSSMQMIQRIHNLEEANTLSDSTRMEKKSADVTELISNAMNHLGKVAKLDEVEIRIDLSGLGDIRQVQADSELLELAFQNVFLNQIYYADSGTAVTVSGQVNKDKNQLEIVCSGFGKPIPVKDLDAVFAGYHEGKKFSGHTEGSGIGLFLAKKILILHNGDISVTVNDKNTVFTITLPL